MTGEYSTLPEGAPACLTCYIGTDHLGTTRLVTDTSGAVIGRHDYLPFGEEIPASTAGRRAEWGALADNVDSKFTGQSRDQDSGLDYFKARYYAKELGRFTSPDPDPSSMDFTTPQTFNRYAYVLGNPLGNVDPSGADICEDGSEADACVSGGTPPDIPTVPIYPCL